MKEKARLLVTLGCSRQCYYCPNQYEHVMSQAVRLRDVKALLGYREVMISGGEPLLSYDVTATVIDNLRLANQTQLIYLYASVWQHHMIGILAKLNGFQYTIHSNATLIDMNDFSAIQDDIRQFPGLSYRLAVIEPAGQRIVVESKLWDKIVLKPPRLGEDCIVPEDEDLYIFDEDTP